MSDLDDRLVRHYENQKMDADKLAALLAASEDTASTTQPFLQRTKESVTGVAGQLQRLLFDKPLRAAFAIAVLSVLSVLIYETGSSFEREELTFRQVALNHATRLEFEFTGATVAALDESMQQLPFSLVKPKVLTDDYRALGSRYCTLGGNLAAHVKFRHQESGRMVSLFVTTLSSDLMPIVNERDELDGVDVNLWQEGGLFYALAEQNG